MQKSAFLECVDVPPTQWCYNEHSICVEFVKFIHDNSSKLQTYPWVILMCGLYDLHCVEQQYYFD